MRWPRRDAAASRRATCINEHAQGLGVIRWSLLVGAIGVCASPTASPAQRVGRDSAAAFIEMQWNLGAYTPLGRQRQSLAIAPYYELAVLAVPLRRLAIVASAALAQTHDRENAMRTPVEVTDFQGGLEVRPFVLERGASVLKPFVGLGLGARSYHYVRDSVNITSLAGYASLGITYQHAVAGVRIAASDHMSGYRNVADRSRGGTRQEVVVTIGLIARVVP